MTFQDESIFGGSVYKPIANDMLESGEVSFGPREAAHLQMPKHSTSDLVVQLPSGQPLYAAWDSRRRVLHGDGLHEFLELEGRAGWMLRAERSDGVVRLSVVARRQFETGATTVPPPTAPVAKPARRTRRARVQSDRFRMRPESEFDWVGRVGIHRPTIDRFKEQISQQGWDPAEMVALRLDGERLAAVNDYEDLLALDFANIDHMAHQEATAIRVLKRPMQGRAVLADEVGLGKTIEAGLILKELSLRGMARRILVVCPAGLREQWKEEMASKFEETFEVVTSGQQSLGGDRLIMSLQLARNNRELVTKKPWDLVIIDEAHRLAGKQATETRAFVNGLKTQRMLFLTATPVQNSLLELYRLVELLRPGTFQSERQFRRDFFDPENERHPVKPDQLRRLIRDVMVRTTRAQAGLDKVTRRASDVPVRLNADELAIYRSCLDVIRGPLAAGGHHFQRNFLAKRLTISPRALAPVALRMAKAADDERAARSLAELGHACGDFGLGTRERVAIDQTLEWVEEHGRVLVFTQHTDVLEALMRAFEEREVQAIAYHGQMSSTAKGEAIDRFTRKRNWAPILVSTDAGAEGLNLQAANCVLNFDLPWNPMRIEQRIGRVHRVTQTRDVYVRNLVAVDTIDESVYWLLREKLAMFELLFGQVTTILGELDTSANAATFEQRIAAAVAARSDAAMSEEIKRLGKQLEIARASADAQIKAGSHIDRWASGAAADAKRRKNLPVGGATELRPAARKRQRTRQREVGAFARRFLGAIGAEVTRDKANVISARLPADWVEDLDGREEMHLALAPDSISLHPDAELFSVGTESFDQVLDALRLRGDLSGRVLAVPPVDGVPIVSHTDGVELVDRRIAGPTAFATKSTWRVTNPEEGDEIVAVESAEYAAMEFGDAVELGDDTPLTGAIKPKAVLDRSVREARRSLAATAQEKERGAAEVARAEAARVTAIYDEQIAERAAQLAKVRSYLPNREDLKEEVRQLEKARSALQRKAEAAPEVELRAELLAIDVRGGATFQIREEWSGPEGARATVESLWSSDSGTLDVRSASGATVRRLAVCRFGHGIDADETETCPDCGGVTCVVCAPDEGLVACALCGGPMCGRCGRSTDGLCAACASPVAIQSQPGATMVEWTIGGGGMARVSNGVVEVLLPAGRRTFVPDDRMTGFDDRCRAWLASQGIPLDAGISLDVPNRPATSEGDIFFACEDRVEWVDADPSAARDPGVVAVFAGAPDGPAVEPEAGFAPLFARLRERIAPAPPVARRGLTTYTVRTLRLGPDAVIDRTVERSARGEVVISDAAIKFRAIGNRVVAHGEDVEVVVEPVHNSAIIDIECGGEKVRWFAPSSDDVTLGGERAWIDLLVSRGYSSSARTTVNPPRAFPANDDFAMPRSARLVARDLEHSVVFVPGVGEAVGTDAELLRVDPGRTVSEAKAVPRASRAIAVSAIDLVTAIAHEDVTLREVLTVSEQWSGAHGVATVEYEVPLSGRVVPPLATGAPCGEDFTTDSFGHLADPADVIRCGVCERASCSGCESGARVGPCPRCERPTCGSCASTPRPDFDEEPCARCGEHGCGQCGRDVGRIECALCRRYVCRSCADPSGFCVACEGWRDWPRASPNEIGLLPPTIGAAGIPAAVRSDGATTVALLAGPDRREVVVIEDGEIASWRALDGLADGVRAIKIAAANRFAVSGDASVTFADRTSQMGVRGSVVVLVNERKAESRWAVRAADGTKVAGSPDEPQTDSAPVAATDVEAVRDAVGLGGARTPEADLSAFAGTLRAHLDDLAYAWVEPSGTIEVEAFEESFRVALTRTGLRSVRLSGRVSEESDAVWAAGAVAAEWASDLWEPSPSRVLSAVVPGGQAALVVVGDSSFIAFRPSAEAAPMVYEVSGEGLGTEGFLLARIVESEVPLIVTDTADPRLMTKPHIEGWERVEQRFEPLIEDAQGAASTIACHRALDIYGGGIRPRGPATVPLPDRGLAAVLSSVAFGADLPEPRRVSISATVRERWMREDTQVEVEYVLNPGERAGRFLAYDTHERIEHAVVDARGHLVASVTRCEYCDDDLCARCEYTIGACNVCGSVVCGRCAGVDARDDRRCPACAALRVVTPKIVRAQGLPDAGRAECVLGRDVRHVVLFTRPRKFLGRGTWSRWTMSGSDEWASEQVPVGSDLDRILDALIAQ